MILDLQTFKKIEQSFGDQVVEASNNIMLSNKQTSSYKCGYQQALIDCLQFLNNVYTNKDSL